MYRVFVSIAKGGTYPTMWFAPDSLFNDVDYMKIEISGRISKGEIISRIRENYVDFVRT